jgi:pimeloyl-ACP methyl ester carboxylesterase
MPYANHQGIRIHYQVEGEGPPLVLQHGFTGNLKRWYLAGYVDVLKPKYQLILVDARGHGASDKPHDPAAYTLPLHVGDIIAVLDALHLNKVNFWGYSMGGYIGFGMAKYAPQRLHALIIGGAQPYGRQLAASPRLDGSDPDKFVAEFFRRLEVDTKAFPPAIQEELYANDFRALAAALQDRPSLEDLLPKMNMPCFLYASDADPVFPKTQACAQQIPKATFFPLHGLDHSAAFREAKVVLPQVTQFLQGVCKGLKMPIK